MEAATIAGVSGVLSGESVIGGVEERLAVVDAFTAWLDHFPVC